MAQFIQSIRRIPSRFGSLHLAWWWNALLFPFLATRLAWALAALYASRNFQPNPTYQEYADRGWFLSKYFLLDIFSRWDARYYLSIARDGYQFSGALGEVMDNIAFFPLYPYLVKGLGWLAFGWTGQKVPDSLLLLIGILLSNLFFLAGMALLYRLAVDYLNTGENSARRALDLIFLFPVSFIFSSFYTESLFFFLSTAAFLAAYRRRWMMAGVLAGLLALTRSQGILVGFALLLVYLQQKEWRIGTLRPDVLWLGLSPVMLASHLYNMFNLTGSFLAPFQAHEARGFGKYSMLEGLRLQLEAPYLDIFKLDAVFLLLFLACGIFLLYRSQHKGLGVYAVLMVIVPVVTGTLISGQRFMLVVFPVFLLLGEKIRTAAVYDFARGILFTLQIVYFTGWVNYYWIV